ncbi:MAG: transcriptional coactivator p15/PC4 family protein [Deltaproteobacteria bacterium]|nr:transcriptional coactivator p15/PC4 family protein [Deltaproteobacteria bacterium]MBW2123607.1 transcriptional coactivator p15/PC4 family protein [Deltaproteobacteria bacterium]
MADNQKEIGRMRLNVMDSLVFQTSEYRGKKYVDIRKYVESQSYTGFTKQGIRFNAGLFEEFMENLKKVSEDLGLEAEEERAEEQPGEAGEADGGGS